MSSNLVRLSISFAAVIGLLGVCLFHPKFSTSATQAARLGPQGPVLVELFTSEGCSSCPPADALLKRLSEQQPVEGAQLIALEEHVDYWNHLGWTDPFSSHAFSERQDEYARAFGADGVYTPQMVVDGQFELVGSRGDAARRTIQKAAAQPKLQVAVRFSATSTPEKPVIEIQISNPQAIQIRNSAELWVAVTETNLQSDVKAGENSGEVLKHAAVVRSLRKFETLRDASAYQGELPLSVESAWKKGNLSAVVFVSEKGSHKVIGAATAAVPQG